MRTALRVTQTPTPHGLTGKGDAFSDKGLYAVAHRLGTYGEEPERLVVGQVAKTVRQVKCTWKNGVKTTISRVPATTGVRADAPTVRTVDDSPYNWFVCLAPQGTEYASAEVTGQERPLGWRACRTQARTPTPPAPSGRPAPSAPRSRAGPACGVP